MGDPRVETVRCCAHCNQVAVVCDDATRYLLNGIFPSGTVYRHHCRACGRSFKSESPWRTFMALLLAAIPMALFVVMIYAALPYLIAPEPSYRRGAAHTNWWLYVTLGVGFLLMSIGVVASSAWR